MTNTKFRKRALLSSVAMLLVALVALGSATFAWYAATTTVSASGMSFTTSASSGLKIAAKSQLADQTTFEPVSTDYSDSIAWNLTGTLQPASFDSVNGNLYTATGLDADHGTLTTVVSGDKKSQSTYCVSDTLYFMQDANGSTSSDNTIYLTGVTINPTSDDTTALIGKLGLAIRVVITDHTGAWIAEYAIENNDTAPQIVNGAYTSGTTATKDIDAATTSNLKVSTGEVATGSPVADNSVNVYVYLDGFNADVTSRNGSAVAAASSDILDSIALSFTMDAAPAQP